MKRINPDSFPHLVSCASRLVRIWVCSRLARVKAAWWGVRLGTACRFDGLPIFRRHPASQIVIGSDCLFNSGQASNLIGVNHPCMVSTLVAGAAIKIGAGCGFSGTVIASARQIVIGHHVRCGANTLITDTDWHGDDPRTGPDAPVEIGDEVWLGLNVVVLKGVTIGPGTFVGANSLVTKSLPPRVIAGGNPAKVIRNLEPGGVSSASPTSS